METLEEAARLFAAYRLDEAGRVYRRLLSRSMRDRDDGQTCLILLHLASLALLRGRLPLAKKCATRLHAIARRSRASDLLFNARLYSNYAGHLQALPCDDPRDWASLPRFETAAVLATDALIRMRRFDEAFSLAARLEHVDAPGVAQRCAFHGVVIAAQSLLERLHSADDRLPETGFRRADIAAAALAGSSLRKIGAWARSEAHIPLRIDVALFKARMERLRENLHRATRLARAARALSKKYGLLLREIDALVELGIQTGPSAMLEAQDLAARREVNYAWGALWASTYLTLEMRDLKSSTTDDLESILRRITSQRLNTQAHPLPRNWTVSPPPELHIALDHYVPVTGPVNIPLFVPVEQELAQQINELLEAHINEFIPTQEDRFAKIWWHYYNIYSAHRFDPKAEYHLGVLFALEGRSSHARLVAEDTVLLGLPSLVGATLFAAVAPPAEALHNLQTVRRRHPDASPLHHALSWYAEAVLHLHGRQIACALDCLDRAVAADLTFAPAHALRSSLDETREKCRSRMEQTAHALDAWRRNTANGHYPASLQALTPVWISSVPECPASGKPHRYRVGSRAGRFLLNCPQQGHPRYDSSLGWLVGGPLEEHPLTIKLERLRIAAARNSTARRVRVAGTKIPRVIE